ncbi:DNA/pantothenate metabolism flavoprotein, partial [Methanosarcinales archaeon]
MHPVEDIRGIKRAILLNKKIVLGVTGSIAAVETVKLARELIRHGADVIPVMTHASTKIIHPDALWFATGNKPVVELTGKTEHVSFCGMVKEPADLFLISPCTANT